jgi:hypothetical protein
MAGRDLMAGRTRAARTAAFLVLVTVAGTADLAAQSDEEFEKVYPFIGNWVTEIESPDGQDRGNCGGRTGDYGEKLVNCSLPVDQLPLNARAEAWLKYMDHLQSPTIAGCAPIGLPAMLGEGAFISASPGRIVIGHQAVTRTIWMNGIGPRPGSGELFQHGYSAGRFDGSDLVIESTNFTFDPDGIDDHLHMASSVRKKVTERYRLIDDNTLRLIITLEDPTFLTKPFTYAILQTKRPGGPTAGWRACDPDLARREIEFAYPGNKYPDGK